MIEIGVFLKVANLSTAARMKFDSVIIVTITTIAFQLFFK